MADVKNVRTYVPSESEAKNVEDTPMLNTTARESVDMNESNDVGQEYVTTGKIGGPFGATGRN